MHYLKNKQKNQPPPDACVRSEGLSGNWKGNEKAILKDGSTRFLSILGQLRVLISVACWAENVGELDHKLWM